MTDISTYLGRIWDLYGRQAHRDLLVLASEASSTSASEPSVEWGQICRLSMVSSIAVADDAAERIWRARAIAAYARAGCTNGIALVFIPEVIRSRHEPEVALAVLAAMDELIGPPDFGSLTERETRCLQREKRGFINWYAGEFPAALRDYEESLALVDGARRTLKVRGGLANVRWAMATGNEERKAILEETEAIVREAKVIGTADDVVNTASVNAGCMRAALEVPSGDGRELLPYEIV